jgi:hypothetical protein
MPNMFSKNIEEQINQLNNIEEGANANSSEWTETELNEIKTVLSTLKKKKKEWEDIQSIADEAKNDLMNYSKTSANLAYNSFRDKAYGKYTKKSDKLNDYGFTPQTNNRKLFSLQSPSFETEKVSNEISVPKQGLRNEVIKNL